MSWHMLSKSRKDAIKSVTIICDLGWKKIQRLQNGQKKILKKITCTNKNLSKSNQNAKRNRNVLRNQSQKFADTKN